jgi:puromycin-sensitive aminopeptidase
MTSPRTRNPYRLPVNVVPSNYRLELTPDLEAATFSGTVTVKLDILEITSEVHFNAVELDLDEVHVTGADGKKVSGVATLDANAQCATLKLETPLPVGPGTLEVSFRGTLNDQLQGFYRSSFVDTDGVAQTIATTQFEETDARRAFPCWDEPAFKATFDVTLNIPTSVAAYSNSPIAQDSTNDNGTRQVVFGTTMKMSTYLVAFIVGPFEETPSVDVLGTLLRVVYPKGKGDLASFALGVAVFALRFFSEYFDIPYPGDKLDLIAVPDFDAGAMENLGCVTYRESALLVDPETASLAELQRVAVTVAHELSHMWFGDLVTMEWWGGIWLNEAFATFMEVFCTNAYKPEWKMWGDFVIDRDSALQVDGLHSTRAIEYEVVSPADARGMFDVLTYQKGGSVLRMLEQYLGADVFRDGIRHYLRKHSYANTVTADLWDALEEISGHPVRDLMNTWILQGGYPVVTVDNGQLSQRPFEYGPATGQSAIGSSWLVPMLTRPLGGTELTRRLLADKALSVEMKEPMVLNAGGSGVYRTCYNATDLPAIVAHLRELDELERTTLIVDGWAALFAGQMSWSDFWSLAEGLGNQDEPASWGTIAMASDYASRALTDAQRPALRELVCELFGPQFARLGWGPKATDLARTPQLRGIVLGTLGTLGESQEIRTEALHRFDTNDLDGDLARAILRVVGAVNRPGDYEEFYERSRNGKNPQEELRFQYGLSTFSDQHIALDATEKCFSEIRSQDAPNVIALLTANRVSGPAVWRYVTSRWDEALARFPLNSQDRLGAGIPTFFSDVAFANEVAAFHTSHPLEGKQRIIEQNLEKLQVGLRFSSAVRDQFSAQVSPTPGGEGPGGEGPGSCG